MRNIVFYGNCQAYTLYNAYQTTIAPMLNDSVSLIPSYTDNTSGPAAALISAADIIVAQAFDAEQKFQLDHRCAAASIVWFPTVTASFLWPFGGVPHSQNQSLPHFGLGPYDCLMGDKYLNRRIAEGVDPDVAVDRYLSIDIVREAHVDRLYEIVMDRQRARDERCGTDFYRQIEDHFRDEHIFLNHYHPGLRIAQSLARSVYSRMGIPNSIVDHLVSRWRKTPFQTFELPIHPGIVDRFKLKYGGSSHRYLYHTGEMLDFDRFSRQYAAFTWNDKILKGIHASKQSDISDPDVDVAIVDLTNGLAASQGTSAGERALATLLDKRGRLLEALAAAYRAVSFDPSDADSHGHLADLLVKAGRLGEAEEQFIAATREDPAGFMHFVRLAIFYRDQGRTDEALANLQTAVEIVPNLLGKSDQLAASA